MTFFTRALLALLIMLAACKSKKASLAGDDPVDVSDFIESFPVRTSYQFSDTVLLRKEKDSLVISHKVFTQFVPDSVLGTVFGKGIQPKIYPMARISSDETYLFAKAISGNKRAALIIAFDKDDKFIAAMPLLKLDQSESTQQLAGIDSRLNIQKITVRKNADGTVSEGKDVFVLNKDAAGFMLIMTDPLEDKATELINPIDTFSRKQKYAADYGSSKMNIVSFRDGRKPNQMSFFIHFEKNNGQCVGELKGEAVMKTATQAEYREAGEPCALQFVFTNSTVLIKEIGGCGSRRGLRCSFDGVYFRKKEADPKAAKTKTK